MTDMATESYWLRLTPMPPPPPPPPGMGPPFGPPLMPPGMGPAFGPPAMMPLELQDMMHQMHQRQPKFQQQMPPPGPYQQHQGGRGGFRGGRGGRGRGRGRGGRGRGGFQHQQWPRPSGNYNQSQFKRKRGPSDDIHEGSRFFMPSFLEDPWKQLERGNGGQEAAQFNGRQQREEMRPQQVQQPPEDGPGRVFFQQSFLEDPWAQLVR